MFKGVMVVLGLLEKAFGDEDAQYERYVQPPPAPPKSSPSIRTIINPSPQRYRLTEIGPGIYAARDLYAPPLPGEHTDPLHNPLFNGRGESGRTGKPD